MSISLYLAHLSIFSSAYSQSDFFGKIIFLNLFLLSVICWIVLLQKVQLVRKTKMLFLSFQEVFTQKKEQLLHLEIEDLVPKHLRSLPHPLANVFLSLKQKSLEMLNKNAFFQKEREMKDREDKSAFLSKTDLEMLESHVLTTISSEAKSLEKNLFVLSTIVTLAPFLGLLGTVWGILITFSELHSGGSAGSSSVILGGLSTALVTTVLGLVIAIPALIAHSYLKTTAKLLSSEMEDFLYLLLSNLELQYRKVDP
ncbi:MAG: MotA/TolQ/ExbB proton channel family protein [Anaerolineae bacterium]